MFELDAGRRVHRVGERPLGVVTAGDDGNLLPGDADAMQIAHGVTGGGGGREERENKGMRHENILR